MRIFVAGASGVVGRRIVPLLIERGHDVTGLTRRPDAAEAIEKSGGQAVIADVYDADATAARNRDGTARRHNPSDHRSLRRRPQRQRQDRDVGTRNLVDAALRFGVGRIIAQSIAWAYESGAGPATEATPLDLHADADRLGTVSSIAALENAARRLPEWVVLRYGTFHGPDTWALRRRNDGRTGHDRASACRARRDELRPCRRRRRGGRIGSDVAVGNRQRL